MEKEGADVFLVARDRSRFPAHKAIISCRSDVLGALLARAGTYEGEQGSVLKMGFVLLRGAPPIVMVRCEGIAGQQTTYI